MERGKATRLLERRGEAVTALPGVTGVGLGAGPGGAVIEVFHEPSADVDALGRALADRLEGAPFTLIPMSTPRAFGAG